MDPQENATLKAMARFVEEHRTMLQTLAEVAVRQQAEMTNVQAGFTSRTRRA